MLLLLFLFLVLGVSSEIIDNSDINYFLKRLTFKEGDILVFNETRRLYRQSNSALKGDQYKWENASIPIRWHESLSTWQKNDIVEAILEIHRKTCVRFRDATVAEEDFVLIGDPLIQGCASNVGRIGGKQILILHHGNEGSCFSRKILLHELMHTLGFIHEHNRSDRDQYINIDWNNVIPAAKYNFEKRETDKITLLNSPYSYESIMHYKQYDFAINEHRPTIIPKLKVSGTIGGVDELGPVDTERINLYYNCSEKEKDGGIGKFFSWLWRSIKKVTKNIFGVAPTLKDED